MSEIVWRDPDTDQLWIDKTERKADLFTEEQLPRGVMMVVGRTFDGRELAGLIKQGDPDHNNFMIMWLADLMVSA